MREVVIVDGIRTPIGRAGRDQAYYKEVRGDDLSVACVKRLLDRSPPLTSRTWYGVAPISLVSRASISDG